MREKISRASERRAAPEAGHGAGLDVFNTLPIVAHACRLQCGRSSARSSYLNRISGQLGMEGFDDDDCFYYYKK